MNNHKFQIKKGDSFSFSLDVQEDCSAWTGTMPVYDLNGTLLANVALTFRSDNYIDGEASTASWPVGSYDYYLRVDRGTFIEDILEGDICVSR